MSELRFLCLVTMALLGVVSSMPTTKFQIKSPSASVLKTNADVQFLLSDLMESMAQYKISQRMAKPKKDQNSVCYDDLGCFSRTGDFSNFGKLPLSPSYLNTGFHLFTSGDQAQPEFLNYSRPLSVSSSKFQSTEPIIVVIHGFGENGKAPWIPGLQTSIFQKFPLANFIVVDWPIGASQPDYWQAAANTQMIGAQIAKLLSVINVVTGAQMTQVHLIGFSLGAHVAGLTSQKLVEFGQTRVGRITGLDPAGPVFEKAQAAGRLDEEDADFVQAIHSNGAPLIKAGFGITRRVAHRDFYPNGGQFQPGCPNAVLGSLANLASFQTDEIVQTAACNHFRAIAYAVESIESSCRFVSHPCESYDKYFKGECLRSTSVELDIFAEKSVSDESLYFLTNVEASYCAITVEVTVTIAENSPTRQGSLDISLQESGSSTVQKKNILKNTWFSAGKTYQEIFLSRVSLKDLEEASVEYQRSCFLLSCRENTHLNVTSIKLTEMGGFSRTSCNHNLLYSEAVVVSFKEEC